MAVIGVFIGLCILINLITFLAGQYQCVKYDRKVKKERQRLKEWEQNKEKERKLKIVKYPFDKALDSLLEEFFEFEDEYFKYFNGDTADYVRLSTILKKDDYGRDCAYIELWVLLSDWWDSIPNYKSELSLMRSFTQEDDNKFYKLIKIGENLNYTETYEILDNYMLSRENKLNRRGFTKEKCIYGYKRDK